MYTHFLRINYKYSINFGWFPSPIKFDTFLVDYGRTEKNYLTLELKMCPYFNLKSLARISLSLSLYIYIYIYMCVCVCVCVVLKLFFS